MVGDSLPQGWRWTTVEQVQKPSSKAIVSGSFGSNIGSRFFVESGVPVIRDNNLTTDMRRFIDDGFVFITDEKAEELKNCEAFPNDLIFTAAGTLGQVGNIPLDSEYPRYIVSNKKMRARLDENTILPLFAFSACGHCCDHNLLAAHSPRGRAYSRPQDDVLLITLY